MKIPLLSDYCNGRIINKFITRIRLVNEKSPQAPFSPVSPCLLLFIIFAILPSISFSQPIDERENTLRKGLAHLYKKEIPEAISHFESLSNGKGPSKDAALYYLGYSYYQGRDFTKAREAFHQSYEGSSVPPVPVNGGPLAGENPAASDLPEPDMKKKAPSTNLHFQKGLSFLAKKDFASAAGEFQNAADEDSFHAEFFYYKGYALYKSKKFSQARTTFQEAFRIQPDYVPPPSLK